MTVCARCSEALRPGWKRCPACDTPVDRQAAATQQVGDVGLVKGDLVHSTSIDESVSASGGIAVREVRTLVVTTPPEPSGAGDHCPLCGLWVATARSFRCRSCGRSNMCAGHLDRVRRVCEACAALDGSPPEQAPARTADVDTRSVPGMVLVPAGWFWMGSADQQAGAREDEKPRHRVWVDCFFLDRAPVTNREYLAYLRTNPHETPPEHLQDPERNRPEQPVIGLSWDQAVSYARWAGKRLPTEAEWEKAARGGLHGATYPWGNEAPAGRACFGESHPRAVRSHPPNGYGIFDMAGLTWEWCADWYDPSYYARSPDRNPSGPTSGEMRVLRGGSWINDATVLRCACRYASVGANAFDYLGVRCAMSLPAQHR